MKLTKKKKTLLVVVLISVGILAAAWWYSKKTAKATLSDKVKEKGPDMANLSYEEQLAVVVDRINQQPKWVQWVRERAQAESKQYDFKLYEEAKHNLNKVGLERIMNEQWPYIPIK